MTLLVLLGAASLAEAQIVVSSTNASTTRTYEKSGRVKGLVIRPEILATQDSDPPSGNLINIHAIVAYQFNPYFSIGGGLGIDILFCSSNHYKDFTLTSIPLYANAKAYFLDRKFSPYFDLKVGYHIPISEGSTYNGINSHYNIDRMEGILTYGTLGVEYRHFDLGFTLGRYFVLYDYYDIGSDTLIGTGDYDHIIFLLSLAYNFQFKN